VGGKSFINFFKKKKKKQKTRWVWGKNKVPIFFEIKGNFFRKGQGENKVAKKIEIKVD